MESTCCSSCDGLGEVRVGFDCSDAAGLLGCSRCCLKCGEGPSQRLICSYGDRPSRRLACAASKGFWKEAMQEAAQDVVEEREVRRTAAVEETMRRACLRKEERDTKGKARHER